MAIITAHKKLLSQVKIFPESQFLGQFFFPLYPAPQMPGTKKVAKTLCSDTLATNRWTMTKITFPLCLRPHTSNISILQLTSANIIFLHSNTVNISRFSIKRIISSTIQTCKISFLCSLVTFSRFLGRSRDELHHFAPLLSIISLSVFFLPSPPGHLPPVLAVLQSAKSTNRCK